MNLNDIQLRYASHPQVQPVAAELKNPASKLHFKGLVGSAISLFLSAVFRNLNQVAVVCLNDHEEAAYFFDDMNNFGLEGQAVFFPSSFRRSIRYGKVDRENIIRRTDVLNRLKQTGPLWVVTYPEALAEKVVSPEVLVQNTLRIAKGDKISSDFINEVLFDYGFERVDFVYEPGQYAVRGGIVDIFSFAHDEPFRLDFFGDEVDSIRSFNIDTQLSIQTFDSFSVIPNLKKRIGEEKRVEFFSYLSKQAWLAFANLHFAVETVDQFESKLGEYTDHTNDDDPEEEPLQLIPISGSELAAAIDPFAVIDLTARPYFKHSHLVEFNTTPQPAFNKKFDLLANDMKLNKVNGYENCFLSGNEKQLERLQTIFDDSHFKMKFTPVQAVLHEGFTDHDLKLALYTDHQLFERYHRYRLQDSKQSRESITIKELSKLHPGDYVVHIDHGIGKFAGLVRTEVNGKIQEAIRLVYRDNDSLLVSIHSLHRISKYKGKDGAEPNISKLGSGAWQKLKNKAKSKVKDIAKELIALYAERLKEQGYAFSHDSYMQQELEASFLYEDTPDQYKATQAIKADMENLMPMDRLVCGDVGFGKTEVAIRAAFKAAADGKQVAVLVPTTILALQHYKTFSERLKNFPVNVGYVSRLRKASDTKQTLTDLKDGKIDIIIGTHRLVGADVKFKDLGLLIIDEEQKFGVSVKEKLKRLKVNVDTLTLTATPIPRTLQFSLMGARDLSIIQTPPPNRYPIVTEVHGFNEAVIREAIEYEVARGGQVFFIHNRVQNIFEVENMIRKACPKVRTLVGHGQMDGQKLEKVMLDFINGEYDVLIATTIIESGLDIPNANTIIINQAQNFGLSELHQLRGRVGRTNKKAFCYLLAPPLSTLSAESRRRLKAIEEFSELGSGFNIAMQDLDIRGAGNMLGAEQSGFIADIGFETYHRILSEAVQELKHEEFSDVFAQRDNTEATRAFMKMSFVSDCNIDTDLELRFPETYISSISERMTLYRDLDNAETEEQLLEFEKNLNDRFGTIPESAKELLDVVRLRWQAIELGMEKIILKNQKMICNFISDPKSPFYQSDVFTVVLKWIQDNPGRCRIKEDPDKLSMTFDKVKTIGHARIILRHMRHGSGKE